MFPAPGRVRTAATDGVAPHFEADGLLYFLEPVMEIDAERTLLGQSLDDANVAGGDRRRIGFLETGGKCTRIAVEQIARLGWRIDQCKRLRKSVGPVAHDGADSLSSVARSTLAKHRRIGR